MKKRTKTNKFIKELFVKGSYYIEKENKKKMEQKEKIKEGKE